MNREITEPREGRTYFVILDLLLGMGLLMVAAAVGVLLIVVLSL